MMAWHVGGRGELQLSMHATDRGGRTGIHQNSTIHAFCQHANWSRGSNVVRHQEVSSATFCELVSQLKYPHPSVKGG